MLTAFFNVDNAFVTYQRPDGTWSPEAPRLTVERGDAAAVLIEDPTTSHIVLVRQFRYPMVRHGEPWTWELVAGKIDDGETPDQAARRETEEEVNLRNVQVSALGSIYPSTGGLSERIYLFHAFADLSKLSTEGGEPGEDLEIGTWPLQQAIQMALNDELKDAKTVTALLRTAIHRGIKL